MTKHEQLKVRLLDAKEMINANLSKSFAIQTQKEIPPEKTGRAVGNNSPINIVGAEPAVRLPRCEGCIPLFNKELLEFYTANFADFNGPSIPWNPFPQRKNSFIGSDTWLLSDGNRRGNGSKALWHANGPVPLTSPCRRPYLATNWQRTDVSVVLTSKDQRFPTPQVTTRHLFWPNQRRKVASLLPISLRNLNSPAQSDERGAGGSAPQIQRSASTEKGSRNFCPNACTSHFA